MIFHLWASPSNINIRIPHVGWWVRVYPDRAAPQTEVELLGHGLEPK